MINQRSDSNLAEKLTLFLMLVAIFASLFFGLESWFSGKINAHLADLNTSRRRIVEDIAANTDPKLFITRSILPLLRQVSENPQINLQTLHDLHLKKNRLDIAFYQFDKLGQLVKTAPEKAPNLWLMRNMFTALRENDSRKVSQARKNLDKKIEFAFGYGKDLNSIRENPEIIIETVFAGQEGMLAWTSRLQGGLIITSHKAPEAGQIFRLQAEKQELDKSLARIGFLSGNDANSQHLAARAKRYLSQHTDDSGSFAGFQWFFVTTRSAETVFAAFKGSICPFSKALHLTRLLLATLACGIILLFLISGAEATISLKKLVITMFFASSLIPLSGIAFTTLDNLDVFSQIHTNKLRAAKEETLGNLVQNFNKYLASCSATLTKLTSMPGSGPTDPDTIAMAAAIVRAFPEARITIRNAASELLFVNGPDFSAGRETVFKSLSRRLVERYVPERLDEHKYSGNPFSDMLVRKDDMGFGTLLNYPNRLQFVSTGNSNMLLFYRLLPLSAGEAAIAQVELSTFAAIKRYLKTVRSRPQAVESTALQISAFYPRGYRWSLPPLQSHEAQTLQLAEVAHVTGKAQFRRFSDGLNGFALCIPSSELSGNCLVAFCSADPLDLALAQMRQRIMFGSLIAMILLGSIAIWISRQLISPLERLEYGIQAIARRNFEVRLVVPHGKDELAQLFQAYNDMMAESYDMQVAHSVQEGLVPSRFPELPGYSMHGMLRAASDLGGDCLDCFLLPNGNLLFLVGDLTGHGVGSALMMAFTRAITFHWSQSTRLSPTSLADQIDQMLRENRTERMFMGIICGVLDVATHQIELVVKGHIYPLKISADGTKQWMGLPDYPLGIARKKPSRSITFAFNPGDKLLCMTDGFLEARNINMQTVGFDGIENWAGETFTDNAQTWISLLENRLSVWCDNHQSDDLSIFALTRSAGELDK